MAARDLFLKYKDKIYVLFEQGLSSGMNFVLPLFIINRYSELLLAEFIIVQSVYVYILSVFRSVFLNPYIYLRNQKSKQENELYKKLNFYYYLLLLLIILLISSLVVTFLEYWRFEVYILFFLISLFRDYAKNILLAELRFGENSIFSVLSFVILLLLIIITYTTDMSFYTFLLLLCGGYCFIYAYFFIKEYSWIKLCEFFKLDSFYENIRFGKWSFYNSLLQFLITQGLIYSLLYYRGPEAVAVYGIFSSLANMFNPIITSVNNYIAPVMKNIYDLSGIIKLKQFYFKTKLIVLSSLSFVVIIVINFTDLIINLYKSSYVGYGIGLSLIFISVVFSAYNFINSRYLTVLGVPQIVFYTGVASAIGSLLVFPLIFIVEWYVWLGIYLLVVKVMSTLYFEYYIRYKYV